MNLLLLILNTVFLYGTFLLAYWIRYNDVIPTASFTPFKEAAFFLIGIIICSMIYAGVFQRRFRSYWMLFEKICTGLAIGTCLGFIFMYLLRNIWVHFPSSIFLINFLAALGVLFFINALVLRLKGKIQKRVIVLGAKEFYDPFQKKESLIRIKFIDKVEDLINVRDVDEVMICKKLDNHPNFNLLLFLLMKLNVVITFSPVVYADLIADEVEDQEAAILFSTFIGRRSDGQEFLIRFLDIIFSSTLLIGFGPILAIIAMMIKLDSPGPVIYKQPRVGRDRKIFTIYKFRTMLHDAEINHGLKPATPDDNRITKMGRFLRRTRLDELPQLVNIILGQMSLVGPRPENISRVNAHKALRSLRLAVKPGLTGLAQIQSSYDLNPRHKLKYDLLYIQRRSFALNLYIIAKTIPVMLMKKGT